MLTSKKEKTSPLQIAGNLPPGSLWNAKTLREGALRVISGTDPLSRNLHARLLRLRDAAASAGRGLVVREPSFAIDPQIVGEFRKTTTSAYWKKTLADHQGGQEARPLPAFIYQERDWNAFITPYLEIRTYFSTALDLTIAGIAFDDEGMLDGALAIWRAMVAWKPGGFCDDWHGDMISTVMCLRLARVALWQQDRLTKADWDAFEEMLSWRLAAAQDLFEFFELQEYPYDSHVLNATAIFAATALALEARLPALGKFAEWARRHVEPLFPSWGARDGGWGAGSNYWKWSVGNWLLFVDVCPLDHPLRRHPWLLNTGWFKLYVHPPYTRQGAFGDHGDIPPGDVDGAVLLYLGALLGKKEFVWYAAEIARRDPSGLPPDPSPVFSEPESLVFALTAASVIDDFRGGLPRDLPGQRCFPDTGIVASHTHLGDHQRDVMLLFRSSQGGTFNHCHADQNAFVLEAFGEPLLIDAGYYPIYHHPHMRKFSIQTAAHNAVLLDGIGQTIRNLNARGKILRFSGSETADWWSGDATEAYGGRCLRALRHLWFEKDADMPFFLVMDVIETAHPHTMDWLLQSYEKMEIHEESNRVLASGWSRAGGRARARIDLLTPTRFYWRQTDQFPAPADMRETGKAPQWSLSATPRNFASRTVVIAAIQVGVANSRWHSPELESCGARWRVTVGRRRFLADAEEGFTSEE